MSSPSRTATSTTMSQDIGHFCDSLSPYQRTFLQRMLGEFMTVIPQEDHEHPHLQMIKDSSRDVTSLMKTLRSYESVGSDLQPFQISFPHPGQLVIKLSSRINGWQQINSSEATSWLNHTHAGMVTMDMSKLNDVQSSTLAWMINIAHRLPNEKVYLKSCSMSIQRSIKMLNLHRILCVVATDSGLLRLT
jgi:hypothetical protein